VWWCALAALETRTAYLVLTISRKSNIFLGSTEADPDTVILYPQPYEAAWLNGYVIIPATLHSAVSRILSHSHALTTHSQQSIGLRNQRFRVRVPTRSHIFFVFCFGGGPRMARETPSKHACWLTHADFTIAILAPTVVGYFHAPCLLNNAAICRSIGERVKTRWRFVQLVGMFAADSLLSSHPNNKRHSACLSLPPFCDPRPWSKSLPSVLSHEDGSLSSSSDHPKRSIRDSLVQCSRIVHYSLL
jgi:hypothetical protein